MLRPKAFHLANHRCVRGMSSAAEVGENELAVLGVRGDSAELLCRWYCLQGLPTLPFLPAFAVKNLSYSTCCSFCCLVSGCCCFPSLFLPQLCLTSKGVKLWFSRNDRPVTGTSRNSRRKESFSLSNVFRNFT